MSQKNLPYSTAFFVIFFGNSLFIQSIYSETTGNQIDQAEFVVLPALKLQASQEDLTGYASSNITLGLGGAKHTQREIANSISVINREKMDDVNAIALEDALKYTPGLSIKSYGINSAGVESRGYGIDHYQIDGVSSSARVYENNFALAMYDRMEVMRGASGLLQGTGDPGGTINLVRKKAQKEFGFNAKTSIGSWNHYYVDADVTGSINKDESLRGRLIASYLDRDYFTNIASKKQPMLYGTLEYDLDDQTTLSLGHSWQRTESHPFYGLPAYNNGTYPKISRSTYVGTSWDNATNEVNRSFIELEHHLAKGGKVKVSGSYLYQNNHSEFEWGNSNVDLKTGNFNLIPYFSYSRNQEVNYNAEIIQPFKWHDLDQEFVLGTNYQKYKNKGAYNASTWGKNGSVQNIFHPNYHIPKPDIQIDDPTTSTQTQSAAYGQTRIKPIKPVTVVLGARIAWYENAVDTDATQKINAKFVPYVGFIYDLNKNLSAYTSYSNIFSPQSDQTSDLEFLKPRVGHQYEIGLKGGYFDDRLTSSISIYQIDDENRAMSDPNNPNFSIAAGKVRSKGVETELTGQLTEAWKISAGYSYNTAIQVKAPIGREGLPLNSLFPRNSATLWTDYKINQGMLSGFSFGGGYRYRGAIYSRRAGNSWGEGGLSLFDLQMAYQVSPKLKASFTVKNVFDKRYYDRPDAWSRQTYFGDPRNMMFTLNYKY
ncbi:hypothetical protein B9T31_11825 [Acinetobacter sp. ANC 4558]|uniref:TonB-dependent siderophore receptor n=1 Tax=Acinetobacter sp. ANC 4558 TaxID=1977876 RepID=UPI000A32EFA1|nr:TonB-dependent siderophore receptor [Acinetobacter sp. ANC 4558]OTG85478.1 hypothetical protein B9T31_11825 [Acinetobacter sp. ANC 4558]